MAARAARSTRPLRHRLLHALIIAVVALTAAGSALATWGGARYDVGPLETELSLVPSLSGGVQVTVPPIGRLSLRTHAGPLGVRATVTGVHPERARALLAQPYPGRRTTEQIATDGADALAAAALRGTLVAVLAAVATCAACFRRRGPVVGGAAVVLLTLAAAGGTAWGTLRTEAIEEPRFDGLLAQAPALIGRVRSFDAYSERLTRLTVNVGGVYGSLPTLPVPDDIGSTRVLWVSDIHNNPVSFPLMNQLVRQFGVAAIVDTGDIVDLGSAVENPPLAQVSKFGVPYLFVRGNHDSERTQRFIAAQPNVRVLDDGNVIRIGGIRFTGTGHPLFRANRATAEQSEADARRLHRAGQQLAASLDAQTAPVDVAVVHDPRLAQPSAGRVPLILTGHAHERRGRRIGNTLQLAQGSSGGAGLRTLDRGDPLPLQMSILHFDVQGKLLAVDDLTVGGLGERSVTLQRRTPESYPEADAPPGPSTTQRPNPR